MNETRFVPPDDWHSLPIQPPAGYWLRRMRPFLMGIMASVGLLSVVALSGIRIWWILWLPVALVVVQGLIAGTMVALSLKPFHQERKLGYTTWPSNTIRAQGKRNEEKP